jgi:hypothetical protein
LHDVENCVYIPMLRQSRYSREFVGPIPGKELVFVLEAWCV